MYHYELFLSYDELVSFLNENNIPKENIIYIGDNSCRLIYIA